MKYLIVFAVLIYVIGASTDTTKNTSTDTKINYDHMKKNENLLYSYVNCALEKGPCTAEGTKLKKILPEALKSDCQKCNDQEKDVSQKVLKELYLKNQAMFKALEAKYDPQGNYMKKYQEQLKKL